MAVRIGRCGDCGEVQGYRYPIEVIGHAVWLYHRFALSLRDVDELMLARGVVVSHETIRSWCAKFGPNYAARLCRRGPRPGDKWHFDEEFVKINGAPITCGARSTSTATCSTSWCSRAATRWRQPVGDNHPRHGPAIRSLPARFCRR